MKKECKHKDFWVFDRTLTKCCEICYGNAMHQVCRKCGMTDCQILLKEQKDDYETHCK
jgi:hypothetical protein